MDCKRANRCGLQLPPPIAARRDKRRAQWCILRLPPNTSPLTPLQDVRNIISDDDRLQEGVLPALREYNLAQFIAVDVPGTAHQSIVSEAARVDATERFLDPRSQTSFAFDHLILEASDPQPADPNADSEPFRSALEKATLQYLSAHFLDGVSSVFSSADEPNRFVIQVVANKYNPANYWSGRWRSEYIVDLNEHKVDGKVLVNVHYYEQGNVQLATTHTILALIESEEGKFQSILNDTYQDMGEKTFKGLRRALPLTRQKMDWDKVLGYKLGAELSSSKGVFGSS
ncbi:F-actin-capping protein subunit alpha [Armillaria mellea]|nr:F-actin-capping protein subunit alpha [Armillaria mellea]